MTTTTTTTVVRCNVAVADFKSQTHRPNILPQTDLITEIEKISRILSQPMYRNTSSNRIRLGD